MKKVIGLFIALAMIVSMTVACSPKGEVEDQIDKENEEQVDVNEDVNVDEDKDQDKDQDQDKEQDKDKEETEKDEENIKPDVKPDTKPENKPDKKPVVKPGNTPNTVNPPKAPVIDKKQVDINKVHAKLKSGFGQDYIPNSPMPLESLVGIKASDIKASIAEMPMITVNVDTFIAIQAKENKADEIEKKLNAYRKSLVEQSTMYPMNQAKVNASKVVRHGDYVFFVMLGKYDEREDITEKEALEFAKQEVKRAESIINGFF